MKENVLEVLMYLFENYMEEQELVNPDKEELKVELHEAGFADSEVEKALKWLEGLAALNEKQHAVTSQHAQSMRVFTRREVEKLDTESRGFIIFLENIGVLDNTTREMVIDRSMALDGVQIDLEQVKWVVLMVLFNQPGQEAAFAWMEDLVFDEYTGSIH